MNSHEDEALDSPCLHSIPWGNEELQVVVQPVGGGNRLLECGVSCQGGGGLHCCHRCRSRFSLGGLGTGLGGGGLAVGFAVLDSGVLSGGG